MLRAFASLFVSPSLPHFHMIAGVDLIGDGSAQSHHHEISSRCVEMCPGVLQIRHVKALGEPIVDGCQQLTGVGALAGTLPIPDGLLRNARLRVVVGQQVRLGLRDIRKGPLQDLRNARMGLLARTLEQRTDTPPPG
jgi:hypothetical protein